MASCLKPIHIKIDDEGHTRQVPCGKCNACLVRSRMEWAIRLKEELRVSRSSFFITLTYDNDHMPIVEYVEPDTGACFYAGNVCKEDIQKWLKRFRKLMPSLRYYLISEYGPETLRPHYHGIFFFSEFVDQDTVLDACRRSWPFCDPYRITAEQVTDGRILYVTEYALTRASIPTYLEPNFRLTSRRPGLGASYVDLMSKWHLADETRFWAPGIIPGTRANLPRYYRDKIFDKETRETHTSEVEMLSLRRRGELAAAPDYDPVKYQRDEMARVADYKRRTDFLLNKKAKKL